MGYKTQEQIREEHEDFKNRLVTEVLGQPSGEKVPMEKVVMLIWQFRDDPAVVTYMAKFVTKYAGSRQVFDSVEFYLPQLAHMIIHLEAGWNDAILERFALVIAQQSLHFALQFNWILQGAIEDYQPELPGGLPNPNFHPLYYARCMKLLTNLERCVVYGRPRSKQFQRLYEQGKITRSDFHILEAADRRFHALQLTSGEDDTPQLEDIHNAESAHSTYFGGVLLYKRAVRLGCLRSKGWKKRYFVIDEQMFNCYRSQEDAARRRGILRAMPLQGATIEIPENGKYPNMFTVSNRNYSFFLRADSEEDRSLWLRMIEQENDISTLFQQNSQHGDTSERHERVVADLTPTQLERYDFFRNERQFIQRLTDIAEELRFEERDDRKKLAPGKLKSMHIAPCVYLPLCNSSDVWRRAIATFPEDTRVFSTKERCPTVMYFLVKVGEERRKVGGALLDVAEYMHKRFEDLGGSTSNQMSGVDEEDEEAEHDDHEQVEAAPAPASENALNLQNNTDDNNNTSAVSTKSLLQGDFDTVDQGVITDTDADKDGHNSQSEGNNDQEGIEGGSNVREEEGTKQQVTTNGDEGPIGKDDSAESLEVTETDFNKAVKDDENDKADKDAVKDDESREGLTKTLSSKVWHTDEDEEDVDNAGGNSGEKKDRIPRLFRDLPRKLATRIETTRKTRSVMDLATDLQLVPIIGGETSVAGGKYSTRGDGDDSSVGSIERGSMLLKDTVLLGDMDEGDIDVEHINRAKQIISGGESWAEKSKRMLEEAAASQKHLEDPSGGPPAAGVQLEVSSLISKSNDDLRQEVFVMQMIHYYKSVFAKAELPIWLKTYRILSTSKYTGLLELIVDSTSIDGLKKSPGYPKEGGLRQYFEDVYGPPDSKSFKAAQKNFMQSLAGYSLVSYFLGLKDRHNGNIMIDTRGHLIFIDFGFAMGMKPGHEFSFERAPFKLTREYVEVMGGVKSDCYKEFKRLFVAGFKEARKNSQIALGLVEIMMYKSNYPCFTGFRYGGGIALKNFEKRLMINVPSKQVEKRISALFDSAREHTGTYAYDKFQLMTCGYAM